MAKTLLPKVTAEKSDLISVMSGRGSHWFSPVKQLLQRDLINLIEIQFPTWVIDLSRFQPCDAVVTSKSYQPLDEGVHYWDDFSEGCTHLDWKMVVAMLERFDSMEDSSVHPFWRHPMSRAKRLSGGDRHD